MSFEQGSEQMQAPGLAKAAGLGSRCSRNPELEIQFKLQVIYISAS
jgi:hypothetical protein